MKGKNLVEACANVLVTSGYTDYAKNLRNYGPEFFQKKYLHFLAVTSNTATCSCKIAIKIYSYMIAKHFLRPEGFRFMTIYPSSVKEK